MRLFDVARNFSHSMRARRFDMLRALLDPLERPLSILDIGGTNGFWQQCGWAGRDDLQITLINVTDEPRVFPNITPRVGDATNLAEFSDHSFDLVFSNSVIEHLFTLDNQRAMAREVMRLAPRYWVQTPNYWFPVEPHFYFVGWHWLPEAARVAILQRRDCGWRRKTPDKERAREIVREVRLMTRRELSEMFPGAMIFSEKLAGLNKSWIAIDGFGDPAEVSRAMSRASSWTASFRAGIDAIR